MKIKGFFGLMTMLLFVPVWCGAQTMVTTKADTSLQEIKITSFPDYAPVSYIVKINGREYLNTVFDDALQDFAKIGNFKLDYIVMHDYKNAVSQVRQGKIAVLAGIYYGTKRYSGLEYIYPSLLNNPVNIITMPQTSQKIKTSEDLKTLKGVYSNEEYFSDYMLNNFKAYNITPVENTLTAYKKLFTGEADYIAGTYYYQYVKVCELGLKNYVSFSQMAMWSMPMFIGVSKADSGYKRVSALLKKVVANPVFSQKINQTLKAKVKEFELNSQGIVPPEFVRKSVEGELTPADEAANTLLGNKKE